MVALRVLTGADWPLWREVRRAALAQAPHAFNSRLADWDNGVGQRWRERLELPGAYNIVALLDDRPVGLASGVPGDGGVCQLRSVWVSPEVRGQGVGDRLVAAVVAWARRSGAAVLELTVVPSNAAAIALYRRHGFAMTDREGGPGPDGVTRVRVMVKALRS